MAKKEEIPFEDFLITVDPKYQAFVFGLHEYMLENDCKTKIELKSSGHLVSYQHTPTKKVIVNFVFRKKGLIVRIYGDNVNKYLAFMEGLPVGMAKSIAKAPVCKRLVNPNDCNPKCSKGYDFNIGGEHFQKCRYNCFMFEVNDESNTYIKSFIENEIKERIAS